MFRFEKYEDSLEEQWDKFIAEKSINGTFLQSRRFFNYHPAGRFKDVLIDSSGALVLSLIVVLVMHSRTMRGKRVRRRKSK